MVERAGAVGLGIVTLDADGAPLDVRFPNPDLRHDLPQAGARPLTEAEAIGAFGASARTLIGPDSVRRVFRRAVEVVVPDLEAPVCDLYDGFLRLHLLSLRKVRPNTINLEGLPERLDHAVAWTSLGPCRPAQLNEAMLLAQSSGAPLVVRGVFPIPPMLDYVCPSNVTIADSMRVLLGAHLAPGTIVLPEGYCSLSAGTLGPCMVEGRISAGVVIDEGCHIGGGASLMGMSAGGGKLQVSLGKRCLLGANSGVGIALGDDCLVEAGCYVTAGAPVTTAQGVVKAAALSGASKLIFRRNTQSGVLEAIPNTGRWDGLNLQLHPPVDLSP